MFIHFNVPEAEGGIKWIDNAYLKLHPCKRAGKGPTAATGGKVCNAAGWKEPPVCDDDDVDRMVKKGAGPERPLAMCIGIKKEIHVYKMNQRRGEIDGTEEWNLSSALRTGEWWMALRR